MESNLFNPKTVSKLTKNVTVNAKQKKAVNKWLNYLKNLKLQNEKQAYIEFANVILKDLCGYDISLEGLKHEEENIEFLFKKNKNNLICFEVKGAKTKDLWAYQGRTTKSRETPVNQINSYMYDKIIPFGILTNYKLFVLFDRKEGSKKYHIIDFTELTNENKLKEFIALFSREGVEKGFIAEVIQQSIIEEREFTKEFYKLYHETRLMLIHEFEENSDISKDASIHFAQLYLNRLMFIFFAEDTGKIGKRIIENKIIKTLDNIHLFSSNSSNISNVLVGLFNDLDKGSDFPVKLFGFNGGLFKHPIPLKIFFRDFRDDKFFKYVNQCSKLKKKDLELNENEKDVFNKYKYKISPVIKNILLMASFDFNSEVNVNILGHIFEQSISDIEDLKNQKESKRKKDGVYYTPEYITDYICRNTIIPYLSKKSINDIPKLISEYENDIEILEKKLEDIKILDPACGSGAFLIKAVEILLEIHKEIQMFKEGFGKYSASTQGKNQAQLILTKWSDENKSKEIILKNIYGVDINEESIEITKLSLFLKMARKNRKLTDLSNHVKQGNSLIDDETVDTETAFDWDKEFPFKFDIVIGNPPYVRVQNLTHAEIDWYKANKKTAFKRVDISIMFMELANTLLKPKGILGYITSNQFIVTEYGKNLRKFILDKYRIKKIIDFGALPIFYGASTYVSIFIFENNTKKNFKYIKINNMTEAQHITNVNEINIDISSLNDEAWKLINKNELILMNRLSLITNLKDIGNAWTGLITGMDEVLMFDESRIKELNFEKEAILPIIRGTDPKRYSYCRPSKYVIYPYTTNKDKTVVLSEADLKNKYPCVYNYLLQNKNVLINRKDSRKTFANRKDWYSLVRFGQKNVFNKFKIVSPGEVKNHKFAIDTSKAGFSCARVFAITLKNEDYDIKYVLTILNSKLIKFYLRQIAPLKQGGFYTYSSAILNKVPLMDLSRTQQKPFIQKADHMLKLNKELSELRNAFIKRLEGNYNLHKTTKKLEKFYELDENMFLKELQKITKTKLSLDQQDTLAKFFNKYKNKITEIRTKIGQIDKEIDPMVYNLYRLTPEEIKIVEKSLK